MVTFIIIVIFISIIIWGFLVIYFRIVEYNRDLGFAVKFRNDFIAFANEYNSSYDSWTRKGNINNEKYIWLTKNVNKIQTMLGPYGIMHYVGAFQSFQIPRYQIIINTLPKFREGKIEDFDIMSSDECMLRYIGVIENFITKEKVKLNNPFIWFREGIKEILSVPLLAFHWFGVLNKDTVSVITNSTIYKFFSGLAALITFISGIVTIIQGKEKTLELLEKIF